MGVAVTEQNLTKLMDGLVQLLTRQKLEKNTCGKKSSCHSWELNPYLLLVEVTRMPIIPMHCVQSQHSTSFSLNT